MFVASLTFVHSHIACMALGLTFLCYELNNRRLE